MTLCASARSVYPLQWLSTMHSEEHRRKHEQNPCPFFLFPPTLAVPPPVEEDDEIVIVEPVAKPNKRKKCDHSTSSHCAS